MMALNMIELTYKSPTMVLTFAGAFRRISSPGGMSAREDMRREGDKWEGGRGVGILFMGVMRR